MDGLALCVLLLFIATMLRMGAQGMCVDGERYDPVTHTCITCVCGAGEESQSNLGIPMDKENGAMACPACQACLNGYFSNQETQFTCVKCSTDCQMEGRITAVPCDKTQNRRCGGCLNGYYEMFPTSPCSQCTIDTSQRPECQSFSTPKTTIISALQPTSRSVTYTSTLSTIKNNGRSRLIETIFALVSLIVFAGIIFGTMKVVKYCRTCDRSASGNYRSVSTLSSGGLESIKIDGTNYTDGDGTDGVEEEGINDNEDNSQEAGSHNSQEAGSHYSQEAGSHNSQEAGSHISQAARSHFIETDGIRYMEKNDIHEENNGEDDQNNHVPLMKEIKLKRSDVYLRLVSTKIDKDPKTLFEELNIESSVIYQETEQHKDDVRELHLQILNRWVSKRGNDATLWVLYEALKKNNFNLACSYIINTIKEKLKTV